MTAYAIYLLDVTEITAAFLEDAHPFVLGYVRGLEAQVEELRARIAELEAER